MRKWRPTIRYLSQTEVHVYALAIAASVLLSFYPFLIVMLTILRHVLHFHAAENALFIALRDYFPGDLGAFIIRNLRANLGKANHGQFQLVSGVFLLFTANGIFEPLEVALNRAWGVEKNRSYLANQILSFFLILICGGLFVGSVLLTTVNQQFAASELRMAAVPGWLSVVSFKIAAIPVTILGLFLTYWILPNRRAPWRGIAVIAGIVGLALEALKYAFLFAWPWLNLKLENEYGPFKFSASLIILSMLASLLVLAGAEWSARQPVAGLSPGIPSLTKDSARENPDLIAAPGPDGTEQ